MLFLFHKILYFFFLCGIPIKRVSHCFSINFEISLFLFHKQVLLAPPYSHSQEPHKSMYITTLPLYHSFFGLVHIIKNTIQFGIFPKIIYMDFVGFFCVMYSCVGSKYMLYIFLPTAKRNLITFLNLPHATFSQGCK